MLKLLWIIDQINNFIYARVAIQIIIKLKLKTHNITLLK